MLLVAACQQLLLPHAVCQTAEAVLPFRMKAFLVLKVRLDLRCHQFLEKLPGFVRLILHGRQKSSEATGTVAALSTKDLRVLGNILGLHWGYIGDILGIY